MRHRSQQRLLLKRNLKRNIKRNINSTDQQQLILLLSYRRDGKRGCFDRPGKKGVLQT